jgi:serine/threonine protein phosphatase PrpC
MASDLQQYNDFYLTEASMSSMEYSAATDVGLKRTNNEDTILSNPRAGLWLVADGMGGHAAGEVASAIVAETIEQHILQGATLQDAVRRAHEAVITAAEAGQGGAGMGSTVVALHSHGDSYDVAWVGDSRAYLWQPAVTSGSPESDRQQGELIQITTDHSYVQMLFDTGAITAAEMHQHPDKNIITQCLGSLDAHPLRVDMCRMQWYPNDWVLLCSDGLSDVVTDEQIRQILDEYQDVESATQALIQEALDQGGKDNVSVSLVACPNQKADVKGIEAIKALWQQWREKLGL